MNSLLSILSSAEWINLIENIFLNVLCLEEMATANLLRKASDVGFRVASGNRIDQNIDCLMILENQ